MQSEDKMRVASPVPNKRTLMSPVRQQQQMQKGNN